MIRKTAQQRSNGFTQKSCVKNHLPAVSKLTHDQLKELEIFWTSWLLDNPNTEPHDGVYRTLCKFILGKQSNFYDKYQALKSLEPHSLEHTKILWGDLWQKIWEERSLSRRRSKKTTTQKSSDFFNRKQVKGKLDYVVITDEMRSEIKSLIETFSPQKINDNINLIVDFIINFQPNFVQRLNQCLQNSSVSMEYLNARYGGNQTIITEYLYNRTYKAKTNLPNTLEYWLSRKHSLEDSLKLRNDHQSRLGKQAQQTLKDNPHKCHFTIDYWLAKGLSLAEAQEVLKQKNVRNLNYFISKYGEDSGIIKFNDMITKRRATFWDKPQCEIDQINKSKGKTFEELVTRHGLEKTCQIIASRTSGQSTVSIESKQFFMDLDQMIGAQSAKSVTGYKGPERWILDSNKIYFVDYYLNGRVIEFLGSFWHADNRLFEEHDLHPVKQLKACEIWEEDATRFDVIRKQGYSLHTIWSLDALKNRQHALDEAAKFLLGH